ncbi:type I restriction enzyme S subunit [Paenibacillus polymyxa]|uniref:restriction endonuclease subunit S n=1 Tax=Paenibacillus polymyxa TaxID=1406 RepID=UPI0027943F46|nr:restriction endonuclease subunit S [Paenibacillus polymyxa]MDQ0050477.1 type I restriction enzyme S subunit [Paenibacillus polymyxa]
MDYLNIFTQRQVKMLSNSVFLGDVVKRVKNKVDKNNTDLIYYIGGEHFDNGEIIISRKGVIKESTIGPAFHMSFEPGHVLLMSRNPHLRKAGVVDFSGVCSDVSYVCETKDETKLRQRFLPFIFQSEKFWEFAEANKKGSTNFFLNWSDFERFEFTLPSIQEQDKLTEILWAANDTKETYKKLLYLTDELVKSQFIEMFGDPVTNEKGWDERPFSDTCDIITGNTPPRANVAYYGNFIEWIKSDNINKHNTILSEAAEYLSEEGAKVGRVVSSGSILMVCIAGGLNSIGNIAIVDRDIAFNQQINALVPKSYETWFLYYMLLMMRPSIHEATNKALKCILSKGQLSNVEAIVPPEQQQKQFALFADQTNKSKLELEQSIVNLKNTIKVLMSKNFG